MIDPNFWQSEDVAKLTIRQRLLLIGLISNADDEGKLRGNPAFIRSIVFPYEDFTVREIEEDLEAIESIGTIIQYKVNGSKYIKLLNWNKFQRVDKPQPSLIPEPVESDSGIHSESESKNESTIDSKNGCENDTENDSRLKEKKRREKKRSIIRARVDFETDSEPCDPSGTEASAAAFDMPQEEKKIVDAFLLVSRYKNPTNLNPDNLVEIGKILDRGIPPDFVIQTMNQLADERGKRGKVTAFSYFSEAIIERWEALQTSRESAATRASPSIQEIESAFSKFLMDGGDPNDFDWTTGTARS